MLLPCVMLAALGSPLVGAERQKASPERRVAQVGMPLLRPSPPSPPGGAAKEKTYVVKPGPMPEPEGDMDYNARKKARFSFEFSKAEVADVVKAISDMTRQNFIIPEKIKGQRITILSPTKITSGEALQVFYNALSSNGISVVRAGRFLKLLDAKEAIKDVVPTCIDDDKDCALYTEQIVTYLTHLHHSDASQVSSVVKSLLSKDGDVTIYAPSNALIISEYAPNLKRVRRILDALDVPGFDDELQLVQIEYSSAAEVAEKLTQIFEVQARSNNAAPPRPGLPMPGVPGNDVSDVQISKMVPDDRTNQIIIKANKRSFQAIKKLIAKLDVPISEAEQGRVHVHYLENAKAEDLASTLSNLSQGSAKKGGNAPGAPGLPMQARAGGGESTAQLFEGEVKITADKATNSLLIMSSAHDFRSIRSIVERLDRPRRQVYVEAAILEVNQRGEESVGFNWHAPIPGKKVDAEGKESKEGISGVELGFVQSALGSTSPSPTFGALTSPTALLGAAGGALGGVFGKAISISFPDGGQVNIPTFGVLLKWLESSSNTNILSTPHLLTTDNEQAKIEVGNKVPFNTGFFGGLQSGLGGLGGTGTTGTTNPLGGLGGLGGLGMLGGLGSVQRIDVSLKLTLTPQINEHNKIRLEIEQTVEDLSGKEARTQTPETAHRSLKTVVVVEDQQTVVLGGLMRDKTLDSETKIPILGDLPILGFLFKQRTDNAEKTNLILVLTPYIVSSSSDFQRIFERKMQEYEEFAAQYYGHRKEYRAHIDYTKKSGPLARLVTTLRRERGRYENGGTGDGSEVMVGPDKSHATPPQAPSPEATPDNQPDAAGKDTRVPPAEQFVPAPALAPTPAAEGAEAPTE